MTKEDIEAFKPIAAMICASIVGSIALFLGINGVMLAGVIGVIAALGGYTLKSKVG